MDPISNQLFSYNFRKFVLQEPNVQHNVQQMEIITPPKFEVNPSPKSSKAKKEKQKKSE